MYRTKTVMLSMTALSLLVCTSLGMSQSLAEPEGQGAQTTQSVQLAKPGACKGFSCRQRQSWVENIGLSDEQAKNLVLLKSDYKVQTAAKKAELKAEKQQLMLLLTEPEIDKKAVLSLNSKIDATRSELSNARINRMLKAMEILTPKQRADIRHRMLVLSLSHKAGKFGHRGFHHSV